MLRLLIAAGCVIIAVLWCLIAGQKSPQIGRPLRLIAAIVTLIGLALVWIAGGELEQARSRQSWPTVSGVVLRSETIGERAFRPNVVYQYTISKSTYVDSSNLEQPSFGGKLTRRDVANKRAAAYQPGEHVIVYYDSHNPDISTLTPQPDWSLYMQTAVGTVLLLAGLLILLIPGVPTDHSR